MNTPLKLRMVGLAGALLLAVPTIGTAVASSPTLNSKDAKNFAAAYKSAERQQWTQARRLAAQARDPVPVAIVDWMEMTRRGNGRSFADIAAFISAHPDWPYREGLLRRAEEAMDDATPHADVIKWFDGREPLSTHGRIRLIAALSARGDTDRMKQMIRETWVRGNFGHKQERLFRRTYRAHLTAADHVERLDYLLWRGHQVQAKRMMMLVDKPTQHLAQARIVLLTFRGGVDWHIRRVPESLSDHPGLTYERARWRRRKDRDADAYDLLKSVPANAPYVEHWWTERSIVARRLLAKGHVSEAYRLVSANGLSEGARFVEAEWLAGWIALRYLKEPRIAGEHFARIDSKVSFPISKARAAYWSGRAAEAAGDRAAAAAFYGTASKHGTTYYGQLAAARTGGRVDLSPANALPKQADRRRFEADSRVRAVRMLHQIEARDLIRPFIDRLVEETDSDERYLLIAQLGENLGRRDLSVRAARKAHLSGTLLLGLAYPVIKMRDGKPEQALLHAIARQESNFDPNAISHAGARGLMQLMPATAKSVARHLRVGYSSSRLTKDPEYNMRLGRSYLGQMLERFNGSYILSIAAYNAGPAAAARWAREFGDPADPGADPIDWVEMIPYRETRNYVQRVLENLQVYRVRLGGPMLAEAIVKDLSR